MNSNSIVLQKFNGQCLYVFVILICILINTFPMFAQSERNTKALKVFYSLQQNAKRSQWPDINKYPIPSINDNALFKLLKPFMIYPEHAKKNLLSKVVMVEINVAQNGHITSMDLLSEACPIFDTVALKIIKATDGHWKSGRTAFMKKDMIIDIPVRFILKNVDSKMYYMISCFYNFKPFYADSTSSFPAQMLANEKEKKNVGENMILNEFYLTLNHSWEINRKYGRIELGFEIDSNGVPDNFQVMTSFAPELDMEAIQQLKDHTWLQAKKNGININSYKVFNLYFDQSVNVERGRIVDDYFLKISFANQHKLDLENARLNYLKEEYQYALEDYKNVVNWYYDSPQVFFEKAMTELKLNQLSEACDDFHRAYEMAEQYGYPLGFTVEQISALIKKYCE